MAASEIPTFPSRNALVRPRRYTRAGVPSGARSTPVSFAGRRGAATRSAAAAAAVCPRARAAMSRTTQRASARWDIVCSMRDLGRRSVALVACAATLGGAAVAQEHVTPRADVLLYGDNTEFRNPFREGETILGAAARIGADLEVSPRVTLSLGVFGNQRFGSEKAFEQVRPVISLRVHGRRSDFVFGTLPAQRVDIPPGPDRMGPHALLPPLQRETLTFDRPYEAGLQWDVAGGLLRHSVWLEWQRVTTPEHRDRFDAGLSLEARAKSALTFPARAHV